MRKALFLFVVLAASAIPVASSAQAQTGKTLEIYNIDTEGGQATLYVAPSGQTLLVDAGNAGERDLNRILEVLKTAGVKQIDHFWLTHYHGDHYGSLIDISKQIPIKHLYDHGPSIEGERPNIIKFQAAYAEFYKSIPRTIVKPGDKMPLAGVDVTTVMSDSVPLKTPIAKAPGAGRPNPLCAEHKPRDESKVDPDNHHSAGFVMNYGAFRTINLGDLTWSREFMLMCPNNPVGTVDLYLTNHHGLDQSNAPALVHALRPRVAIMNNGTRKGGAVQTFQTLETSPGLEDVWTLHWSYAGGIEHNTAGVMIANVDEREQLAAVISGAATPPAGPGGMAAHTPAHYIKVSARTDGSFTVTNSRNGYSKTYDARR
jgi:beta-lactamase superfamily II metal-dependent hydrolase